MVLVYSLTLLFEYTVKKKNEDEGRAYSRLVMSHMSSIPNRGLKIIKREVIAGRRLVYFILIGFCENFYLFYLN